MSEPPHLIQNPYFEQMRRFIPKEEQLYLVGGAIRDAFLQQPIHDLDFVIGKDPRPLARKVANMLGGSYYLMDDERQTSRVILKTGQNQVTTLDFARFRGATLEEDLRARDFTVNAIALPIHEPDHLVDPLKGVDDIRHSRLRACSRDALRDDPVRVMRGIRLAIAFNLRILPDTLQLMKAAAASLSIVSAERRRDELFRVLAGERAASGIRILDEVGALQQVLPELLALKGVEQSPPHTSDVWEHTLATLQRLDEIIQALRPEFIPEKAANLTMGALVSGLGRYRQPIHEDLVSQMTPGRSNQSLLVLAALYHDIAKPSTWHRDAHERIRNFGHEEVGADIISEVGKRLQLSNDEVNRLKIIVRHHMRIHLLAQTGQAPSRKAIYRFFRDTGPSGVEVCLLTLADTLATYGSAVDVDVWLAHVEVCRALLECWFDKPADTIHPAILLNGHELQKELKLQPGPLLGKLLEALREAQAGGEVRDRQEALAFARQWARENKAR